MTQHALSHHSVVGLARSHRRSSPNLLQFLMDRYLLLPLGALIALVWANTAGESYFRFAHLLAFPVNEIGMALFLGLMTQEVIEALIPGGALHTWRRWSLPIVAAGGGLAGSAIVYLGYVTLVHEQVLAQAWPIACSIDIAAGYYVLKTIYRRHQAVSFLLLTAVVTDGVALVVLAGSAPFTRGHLVGVALLLLAVGLAALMRRERVRGFWPYLLMSGSIAWFAFYVAGVHPALALVPIVPFLRHEPRSRDVFAAAPDDDTVHHAEHQWHRLVQGILFLFALVNAGVVVGGYDTGSAAVLWAALIGRPVGILVAVGLAVAAGLHLPRRCGWRDLVMVALATSTGFTLALFFASGLLPVGAVLQQIKLGALATIAGAFLVAGAARLLHVGRFARTAISAEGRHGVSSEARVGH